MNSFLDRIADDLIQSSIQDALIILPTQRACREFRKIYASKSNGVTKLPVIQPISELAESLNSPLVADDLTLLLELKSVYDSIFPPEKMETFLSFGMQILDDFNEIDRQMIDAEMLFQEVKDMKMLDERFGPGAEEAEYIKSFWSEFLRTPYTPLQTSFLQYWKQLPALYKGLRERLLASGKSYEGMAWRHIAETINSQTYFNRFQKVVFAGFYALNLTEEVIFEHLNKKGKLILYADADSLYADNFNHEAGMFFRKGFFNQHEYSGSGNYLSQPKNSYQVIGCNGRFSISRELAKTIQTDINAEIASGNKKSRIVVLADETLLYPFLHQCSLLGIKLNASMGFPLKHHPVYRLLQLAKSARSHSHYELTDVLKKRYREEFAEDPLLNTLLENTATKDGQTDTAVQVEELLFPSELSIEKDEKLLTTFIRQFGFEKNEWMYQVHLHSIHAIETGIKLLRLHASEIPLSIWWELLLEHFSRQRVPFLSDPDAGIPVVGFLESRILDFDVVYIAPLNEGVLPAHATPKSLIPYSLRKAYHLPCKEEQDAVTAYHFYRLLQRATDINFFYNTDLNATGGGERSRYLFQIQHDILDKYPAKSIRYSQQDSKLAPATPRPISIKKTEEILDKLRLKFSGNQDSSGRQSGFSASAINTYIACKLKFYFDQIAGIRPEDVTEGLIGANFGNVLHKCMEMAYSGKGKIHSADIVPLKQIRHQLLEDAIKSEYNSPANTGYDFLMKGVIAELTGRIFDYDEKNSPFEIIGLEEELSVQMTLPKNGTIALKGIIDRLDVFNNTLRILDYKTGNDKISDAEVVDELFTDPEYKLNLQLMLYVLLVSEYYPDLDFPVNAGIFRMRQFDEEVEWLNQGNPIAAEDIAAFKGHLLNLIDEIFDEQVNFDQTDDPDRCRFCDYKRLCERNI